jgi:hypothetical protein
MRLGLHLRGNGEFLRLLELKPTWAVYEGLTELLAAQLG